MHAAAELFGVHVDAVEYTSQKGSDFKEAVLAVDGQERLRFAIVGRAPRCRRSRKQAYGFKGIQSIVRKIKLGKCPYHYIEVMACPKGASHAVKLHSNSRRLQQRRRAAQAGRARHHFCRRGADVLPRAAAQRRAAGPIRSGGCVCASAGSSSTHASQ